jgi:two-component system sensor histidine kinase RegB
VSRWADLSRLLGLDERDQVVVSPQAANLRNMLLLVQLRWVAVFGQLVTISAVAWGLGVSLPLPWLLVAPLVLTLINLSSLPILHSGRAPTDRQLFLALLVDVAALTLQLSLSGGVTNPFAPLFLLQVVLGAILLAPAYAWALIAITSLCTAGLNFVYRPLDLAHFRQDALFTLYLQGSLVCFVLMAVLLLLFVTRINQNLKARDAYLADLRQQAAEQVHIVRMGLLASGAAHELGTPLASLAVILSDWRRVPIFALDADLAADMGVMQAEVERCKAIVTGILMSAGEARGEATMRTTLRTFLAEVVDSARATHDQVAVDLTDLAGQDPEIISDTALRQVFATLFDNAVEAGARHVQLRPAIARGVLGISVADDGRGFPPEILERLGQPYQSTKGQPGAGLGLFLLVNTLRALGGTVRAANRVGGGAEVHLCLPLSALALSEVNRDA